MPNHPTSVNVKVTFRGIEPTEALNNYATEKVMNTLTKYLKDPADVHVILTVEKRDQSAEVIIHSKLFNITGKGTTDNLYSAIDKVADTIFTQLRKQKEKVVDHRHSHQTVNV